MVVLVCGLAVARDTRVTSQAETWETGKLKTAYSQVVTQVSSIQVTIRQKRTRESGQVIM